MRKNIILPALAVAGGAAGFLLRRWQLASAYQPDTGLFVHGAPATGALLGLTALLMAALAPLAGLDGGGAWKIWWRDRRKHKSPNSAQTEAAMAGALGVELAGDAWYFGELHKKPTLGDSLRPIQLEDIRRANRLLYRTAWLGLLLCVLVKGAVLLLLR